MSRTLFIGSLAALGMLVSAGPALSASRLHTSTVPRTSCIESVSVKYTMFLPSVAAHESLHAGSYGDGKFAGLERGRTGRHAASS